MVKGRDKDWYAILEVDPEVDGPEIERAWRRACFKWHPDRNRQDPAVAHLRFLEVGEAYGVLSDPASRASYDRRRLRRLARSASLPADASPGGMDLGEAVREAAREEARRRAREERRRFLHRMDLFARRAAARDGARLTRTRLYLRVALFFVLTCATVALYLAMTAASAGDVDWGHVILILLFPGCYTIGRILHDAWRDRQDLREGWITERDPPASF